RQPGRGGGVGGGLRQRGCFPPRLRAPIRAAAQRLSRPLSSSAIRRQTPMKTPLALLFGLFLAAGALAQAPACGPHRGPGSVLTTAAEVAAHLHDAGMVVLAVTDAKGGSYKNGHIPGALELDAGALFVQRKLSVELPSAEALAQVMTKLGITPQSRIVLYPSGAGDTRVSRAYWTLDALGLGARTSILDGGLDAWTAAGQPLQRNGYADAEYVQAHLHTPGIALVDAREAMDYSGAMEMMGRRGHIPGAVNIPEPDLVAKGRYLPLEALRQKFAAAGVKPGDTVVSYCHIGLMATEVYVAARALGYQAKMYDGSFEDWAAHKNFPVEASTGH